MGGTAARPFAGSGARQGVIEGEGRLVATSVPGASSFKRGERVFHQKFGYGSVTAVEGNKLTVAFEQAGEKKVIDTFVERV
jgi:DNA helicase-2/ATP-dependent DNA helicase PcrA